MPSWFAEQADLARQRRLVADADGVLRIAADAVVDDQGAADVLAIDAAALAVADQVAGHQQASAGCCGTAGENDGAGTGAADAVVLQGQGAALQLRLDGGLADVADQVVGDQPGAAVAQANAAVVAYVADPVAGDADPAGGKVQAVLPAR